MNMEKIIDRLLVEFLVPAFLLLLCILIVVDLAFGSSFNLCDETARQTLLKNSYLLIPGLLFAYLLNTSCTAFFNLISRLVLWGRIREYLMLRKLEVFRAKPFSGEPRRMWWLRYILKRRKLRAKVEEAKQAGNGSLYPVLVRRMEEEEVPAECRKNMLDAYEVVRTIVLASKDNAVIEWIQYHWSQLRLPRSTIIPSLLLTYLVPAVLRDWGCSRLQATTGAIIAISFLLLQWVHYYYRERFMIYAMVGYFVIKPGDKQKHHEKHK